MIYILLVMIPQLVCRVASLNTGQATFEVESAVIRCQNTESLDDDDLRVVNWKPSPLTSFGVSIRPGPHDPDSALDMDLENDIDLDITRMTKCKNQAVITVKVVHKGNGDLEDDGTLIKINHMLDERSGKSVRLGNPIAIKIEEGPVFAVYPLQYLQTVNAKAREVLSKYSKKAGSQCNNDICGHRDGDASATANGFCCSCDESVKGQMRGEIDCGNKTKIDGSYSTHCFRQSDYWYAAFQIGPPEIFHQVYVQVYREVEYQDGTTDWKTVGQYGKVAKIDSHNTTNFQDGDNLSFRYRKVAESTNAQLDKLDFAHNVLLIPTRFYASTPDQAVNFDKSTHSEIYHHESIQDGKDSTQNKLPAQLKNDIDDSVLVVPRKIIGGKCSQAGVTREAFLSQPTPCRETKGTCLRNQPFDLWDTDKNGSTPHYRLKSFAKVHKPAPFKRIRNKMYFVLENEGESAAYIDIQLSADESEILRPGYNAQIVSVVSGCTSSGGKLIVEVANTEQVPAFYSVHLLSCTHSLPLQKSSSQLIDALQMETFQLNLHYDTNVQLSRRATCSVGVLNQYNEVVAFRAIVLSPGDTCICSLNCKCNCDEESKFTCASLSPDEILAAGFLDPEEFLTEEDQYEEVVRENWIYVLLFFVLILIILGLLKGLLGRCCCSALGKFGLKYFEKRPRKLSGYYEKSYSKMDVVYGDAGNPVDPFTKHENVERLSCMEEVGLNAVFFLLLPIFCVGNCIYWCCRAPSAENSPAVTKKSKTEAAEAKASRSRNLEKPGSRTRFGSPASSSNYLYDRHDEDPSAPASHRTLFSASPTPYGSWHKKLGESNEYPQNDQEEVKDTNPPKNNPQNKSANPNLAAQFSGKWKPEFRNSDAL